MARMNLSSALSLAEAQLSALERRIRDDFQDPNLNIDLFDNDNPLVIAFHHLKDAVVYARHYMHCGAMEKVSKASEETDALMSTSVSAEIGKFVQKNQDILADLRSTVRSSFLCTLQKKEPSSPEQMALDLPKTPSSADSGGKGEKDV